MLFIVPAPAAGTSATWAKAASTASATRWLVSTLPATTACGGRALTSEPSGARISRGAYVPAHAGTSSGSRTRRAKKHADRVTASGQLTLPSTASAVPARSITARSPSIVTATRIGMSASVTPSPSSSVAAR